MVVNILHQGYLINCNTGDSRTVLGGRSLAGAMKHEKWQIIYSSTDHNTTHPEKVWHIHTHGGLFLNSNGTYVSSPIVYQDSNSPYFTLAGARVYRPTSEVVQTSGLSNRRTINLTATMGDLLFKLDPPVMTAIPDIQFIPLLPDYEYILMACTDGVWDHLRVHGSKTQVQNQMVLDYVTHVLDGEYEDLWLQEERELTGTPFDGEPTCPLSGPYTSQFGSRLAEAASMLVHRELPIMGGSIFWTQMVRYDDATAQLVHLAPKHWQPRI